MEQTLRLDVLTPHSILLERFQYHRAPICSAELIVEKFYTASNELLKQNGLSLTDVRVVGIGSSGSVDLPKGVVEAASNFPLLKNVPTKEIVAKRLNKPTILENDANAACWVSMSSVREKEPTT